MSNNQNKANQKDSTLLEDFLVHVGDSTDIKKIVEELSAINAKCMQLFTCYTACQQPISEELENEILEFGMYFLTTYGEMTAMARYEKWGEEDAFALRLADTIYTNRELAQFEDLYNAMTEPQQKEVDLLTDKIFSVRKDRCVTLMWDINGELRSKEMDIEKIIPRAELETCKQVLRQLITIAATYKGVVIIREYAKSFSIPESEIYGFTANVFGAWEPIPAENLKMAHCTAPTGEWIEPEEGVTYTSRARV